MQKDDGSVLLRRQLAECCVAVERHAAAIDAVRKAAVGEATVQPPRSGWLVVAGRQSTAEEMSDPNPPRLWFDLTEFGADPTGENDCSVALSAALDAASSAGGGATVFVPAGIYRIARPLCEPQSDPTEHTKGSGAPLPAAVHLIGEGSQYTEFIWEAMGWQLLAAPGGGPSARARWQRAEEDGSSFPFALASHGLVLVHLSIRGTTPDQNSSEMQQQQSLVERQHRVNLLRIRTGGADHCSATHQSTSLPVRYDVRLQDAEVVGFRPDEFDLSYRVGETIGEKNRACQLQHAKQRDHSLPQNLKRGCAVCDHTARAYTARMLLRTYEGWLNAAKATVIGDWRNAAAVFDEAAGAAAAAGETVEAGVLWSNQAECYIRLGEYSAATPAVQKALECWPEHGDSQCRLEFLAKAQGAIMVATGSSCCDIDLNFFGFERTGAKALSHLAGSLHGAATELEAVLAFGSPRAVWCHADKRTPREMRMGGSSALNVAVPNGVAGDTNELTVFQEVDLMCENRQLWCEVKAWTSLTTDQEDIGSERILSSSGGATRWAGLLAQLRRYRDAAQSYTVAQALLAPPEVAAVVQGPPGASEAAIAALRAEGFGCLNLHRNVRSSVVQGSASTVLGTAASVLADLRSLREQDLQHGRAGWSSCATCSVHGEAQPATDGTKRAGSQNCLQWAGPPPTISDPVDTPAVLKGNGRHGDDAVPDTAPTTCGGSASCADNIIATADVVNDATLEMQMLNLDQGMLAVLVANIWDLTLADMHESGAKFLRLFSGETVFESPEGLLATLRPLYRLLTSSRFTLVTCASSVSSFEHFLALRGDDVEKKRWDILRRSDRLQIYPDASLPDVLKPIVVEKCRGAVALGLSLNGALTLIDDILTVRRLRFHPDCRLSLLLTPEGKLRASYLGLGVKGRPTTLQCVGVCRRLRHSSDFSYNSRRAASQVQLVWTSSSKETVASDNNTGKTATSQPPQGTAAEHVGRVICFGCAAAEDAVSFIVDRVFRLPEVWANFVRKARTRWSVETRPWCQRRWILSRLLRIGQHQHQQLLRATESTQHIGSHDCAKRCTNLHQVWSQACDAALNELLPPRRGRSAGSALLHGGSTDGDTQFKVSMAQSQTNLRNAELFKEMSHWLEDAAVQPRDRAVGIDENSEQEDDNDVGLAGAMIGQEDY